MQQPASRILWAGGTPAGHNASGISESVLKQARILVIDDEEANVLVLVRLLKRAGYTDIRCTTDSREAVAIVAATRPDLVLLDLHMPHIDGFGIMAELQPLAQRGHYGGLLPILVLTADATAETKQRALASGATDFLTKPFDAVEVALRIRNLLHVRLLHEQLQSQNEVLEDRVRERTHEVEAAHLDTLERLARAAEYRDDETGAHTQRVGSMAALIAEALHLPASQVQLLRRAAPLHDIGKIGIPDAILLKPGALTNEEFAIMRGHAAASDRLLNDSPSALLRFAGEIAHGHHERWDGTGYPNGLAGDSIPLAARIVAVADVFDALTHTRPYKRAWPVDEAVAEIARLGGRHFDKEVVDAFLGARVYQGMWAFQLDDRAA